jgi:hypothetical protein
MTAPTTSLGGILRTALNRSCCWMDGTAIEIATWGEGFLRALRICTEVSDLMECQIANVPVDHSPTIQTLWGRCVASAANLIATQNPGAHGASRDRLAYS